MLYVLIFLGLLSIPVKADLYREEALQIARDAEQKKSFYLKEAEALHTNTAKQVEDFVCPNKIAPKTENSSRTRLEAEKANHTDYLIFVSFSMPEKTLKALYQEANATGVALILRGLKNNSFKDTTEYLTKLGIGVQIDPIAFKKYNVQKVPTFIWINENKYHTITGNITFRYAKTKFMDIKQ